MSKLPVKSVDVYIKPYYSAENGKAENVFVYEKIDPLLRKNTTSAYREAVAIVESKPDYISPMVFFTLAARAYDFGLRDEAVTWFYRGQNRLITALSVLNLPERSVQENTGFGQIIGQYINPYAFCDLNKQRQAAKNAIDWVITHPYQVVFIDKIPATQEDRKKALKSAEALLSKRLQEQDSFFSDPAQKSQWEKERLENHINERFCW